MLADFCHAMLCISVAYAVMWCPSVCPCVKIFSASSSHTILVFLYQTGWRFSDGNPPNGGVECRWVSHDLFATAELLVKILSLLDSAVNLQQGSCHISHCTLNALLHYLVKYKRSTIAILLMYLTQ